MRGFTLIEVIVVVAVLGLTLAVAASAWWQLGEPSSGNAALAAARTRAVLAGRPIRVMVAGDSAIDSMPVLLLPDGRAVGPHLDLLTGRRIDARR